MLIKHFRTSRMKYLAALLVLVSPSFALAEPLVVGLWPGAPPGPPAKVTGPEINQTKPEDNLIAGRPLIRLGNVNAPEVHVFLPTKEKANGSAVVICPGGGFSILAWDLEGTEVASWLNEKGIAALVVKYRVPTREYDVPGKWQGPVMDTQRALSLARSHTADWGLDSRRVGVMGFSAGGETAALAAVRRGQRLYDKVDAVGEVGCHADFALLIYPGGIAGPDGTLKSDYVVTPETPPMFFVHAADDKVTCLSSTALFTALKKAGVPADLHIFATGGHGYGLRRTDAPVTQWPRLALDWFRDRKLLEPRSSEPAAAALPAAGPPR